MSQSTTYDTHTIERLSRVLIAVMEGGDVADTFTDDFFLDGHPPFWRFQLEGIDAFRTWLKGYTAHGPSVRVVWTIPTAEGFVTEHVSTEQDERGLITARKLLLCKLRGRQISEMTVYCSGDWDEELRSRHAAEAPILRP
jgi:hypothetical protein